MLSGYQSYVCLQRISPIGILLIVVMLFDNPSLCADVTWNVQSDPAVFYSSVYLECEIPNDFNNCEKSIKQWLGGRNYGSLCYGTDCRGSDKYKIMNSTCSYVLAINRFSEEDINCEYTCSYGISNMRKKLTKQVGRFRYYPQHHQVITRSYMQGNSVVLAVNLTKVFPIPQNCSASINGGNVSDVDVLMNWTELSFFYKVELMMKLPVTLCKGEANISCSWDSTKTMKVTSMNYDHCEGNEEKMIVYPFYVVAGVGMILAPIVFILLKRRYHWRQHTTPGSSPAQTEDDRMVPSEEGMPQIMSICYKKEYSNQKPEEENEELGSFIGDERNKA